MKKFTKKSKILITIIAIILALVVACTLYVNDYYHAKNEDIMAFEEDNNFVLKKETLDNHTVVYKGENSQKGFIFYPGGKVEHTAYAPLIEALASKGYLCVFVEMPLNLAILDTDVANTIIDNYPYIEEWYIGGHSLGGSAAAMCVSHYPQNFDGLILLASYSTEDLSNMDLRVLSVYGTEDKVLNMQKYEECLLNLPKDYKEVIIEGGCHAYFGMYGEQEGDGTPRIDNEKQIHIAVEEIACFIN